MYTVLVTWLGVVLPHRRSSLLWVVLQWNFSLRVDVGCGNFMFCLFLVGMHTVSVDAGSSSETFHDSGFQYMQNSEQKRLQWSHSSYLGSCHAEWGLWGGDGRTSILCSFQQYQVMFYKLCFLFSSALVDGYKISQIIFKREPLNATGWQRAISLHTHPNEADQLQISSKGKVEILQTFKGQELLILDGPF